MNINFDMIKSGKGKDMFSHNNFLFECDKNRINSQGSKVTYWKCVKYNETKCVARAITEVSSDGMKINKISENQEQNHLGSSARIHVKKIANNLKIKAIESTDFPSRIIQSIISEALEDIQPYLKTEGSMKQQVTIYFRIQLIDLAEYFDNHLR